METWRDIELGALPPFPDNPLPGLTSGPDHAQTNHNCNPILFVRLLSLFILFIILLYTEVNTFIIYWLAVLLKNTAHHFTGLLPMLKSPGTSEVLKYQNPQPGGGEENMLTTL